MIEIGRLILKTAGRDAGKYGLIIDVIDDNFVMIDGQVRRRKVNIKHIEPLLPVLKISKNAPHEKVIEILSKEGIEVVEKKPKPAKQKPVKKRTLKIKERKKAKEEKKLKKEGGAKKKSTPKKVAAVKQTKPEKSENPEESEKPEDTKKKVEEKKE